MFMHGTSANCAHQRGTRRRCTNTLRFQLVSTQHVCSALRTAWRDPGRTGDPSQSDTDEQSRHCGLRHTPGTLFQLITLAEQQEGAHGICQALRHHTRMRAVIPGGRGKSSSSHRNPTRGSRPSTQITHQCTFRVLGNSCVVGRDGFHMPMCCAGAGRKEALSSTMGIVLWCVLAKKQRSSLNGCVWPGSGCRGRSTSWVKVRLPRRMLRTHGVDSSFSKGAAKKVIQGKRRRACSQASPTGLRARASLVKCCSLPEALACTPRTRTSAGACFLSSGSRSCWPLSRPGAGAAGTFSASSHCCPQPR